MFESAWMCMNMLENIILIWKILFLYEKHYFYSENIIFIWEILFLYGKLLLLYEAYYCYMKNIILY